LLSGGVILTVGIITGFLAQKIKVPDIALFLLAGMGIGPAGLGLINIKSDSALYQIILLFGASYILFDGGASLRLEVLKRVWITIVVLATVGVVITAAITAFAAHLVLDVPWIVALLLGATIASTDPATLVPIFRQITIRDRVAQTVVRKFIEIGANPNDEEGKDEVRHAVPAEAAIRFGPPRIDEVQSDRRAERRDEDAF